MSDQLTNVIQLNEDKYMRSIVKRGELTCHENG